MKNKKKKTTLLVKILAVILIVLGIMGICFCILNKNDIPEQIYPFLVCGLALMPVAGAHHLI